MFVEPRTQDSGGRPDNEDCEGEEYAPANSGGEDEENGEEEEEWRGPGQCRHTLELVDEEQQEASNIQKIFNMSQKRLIICSKRT